MIRPLCVLALLALLVVPDWVSAWGRRRCASQSQAVVYPTQFAPVHSAPYASAPVVYGSYSAPVYQSAPVYTSAPVYQGTPVVYTHHYSQNGIVYSTPVFIPNDFVGNIPATSAPIEITPAIAATPSPTPMPIPAESPTIVPVETKPQPVVEAKQPEAPVQPKPVFVPQPEERLAPVVVPMQPIVAPVPAPAPPAGLPNLPKIDLNNLNSGTTPAPSGIIPAGEKVPVVPPVEKPRFVPVPEAPSAPVKPAPAPAIAAPGELPALELPKLELPKLQLPGAIDSIPPMVPLAPVTAKASPVNATPKRFEIVPIDGIPPASPSESRIVRFFNVSGKDVQVTINGEVGTLPKKSVISAKMPASFKWKLDNEELSVNVPTAAPGIEVLIRR